MQLPAERKTGEAKPASPARPALGQAPRMLRPRSAGCKRGPAYAKATARQASDERLDENRRDFADVEVRIFSRAERAYFCVPPEVSRRPLAEGQNGLKARKKPVLEGFGAMAEYEAHEKKVQRAFRAYMVLIDTADWIKGELRGPLDSFDVTMAEFRVMEILNREGALPLMTVAERRQVRRSNIRRTVGQLERRGWLKRLSVTLPPGEFKRMHRARSRKDEPRRGQRICVIGLTKWGKRFMGKLLPSHSRLVKALMRALRAREQESLVRICEKLREGDVVKFVTELRWQDETELLREKAMAEMERIEGRMRRRALRGAR